MDNYPPPPTRLPPQIRKICDPDRHSQHSESHRLQTSAWNALWLVCQVAGAYKMTPDHVFEPLHGMHMAPSLGNMCWLICFSSLFANFTMFRIERVADYLFQRRPSPELWIWTEAFIPYILYREDHDCRHPPPPRPPPPPHCGTSALGTPSLFPITNVIPISIQEVQEHLHNNRGPLPPAGIGVCVCVSVCVLWRPARGGPGSVSAISGQLGGQPGPAGPSQTQLRWQLRKGQAGRL